MNDKEPSSAFISALTTEHYVLQSALSANTNEVGTRASLYLCSLSSSLVALGFASRSPELFVPFVAIVLPALLILGLFTAVRLVDSNHEALLYLSRIARIRRHYRTLDPAAAEHFCLGGHAHRRTASGAADRGRFAHRCRCCPGADGALL